MNDRVTRRTGINARALASLALFCAGAWLVPSGIALHIASHDGFTRWGHFFMTMHNTASFVFVMAAAVHMSLNWKVLTHYVRARVGEYSRYRLELLIAVVGVSGLVLFAASHALFLP